MGIGALIGALVGLGATGFAYANIGFIAGMGTWWLAGASIGALFDVDPLDTSVKSVFNDLDNSSVPYLPVPVVYGECRVGGNIFLKRYLDEARTKMDLFLSVSEGPISGISEIKASDQDTQDLTTSTFTSHLGTFPQAVDALSPADKQLGYPGTAYVACHLEASSKLGGTPVVSAIVQGRTVWTPHGTASNLGGDLVAKFYKIIQSYNSSTGIWSRVKGDLFFEVAMSDIDLDEYELDESRYYAEYVGYLKPTETGNHTFRLDSSTGADALYIDGELVADGVAVPLVSDQIYSIRVGIWCGNNVLSGTTYTLFSAHDDDWWAWAPDYFTDGTKQRLYWTTPTVAEAVVPSSVLYGGLSEYSKNPVWCLLDYLRSKRYGLGVPDDLFDIDFDNPDGTSTWETVADYCDETMADGNPRYTVGARLETQNNFIDDIQTILSSFKGYLICRDKLYLHVEKTETAYVKVLDESRIIEGSFSFHVNAQNDIPNKVEVTWTDPESELDSGGHWSAVTAVAQNEQRIINEGVRALTVNMKMITNGRQAQEMADYLLDQAENATLYMSLAVGLQDSDLEIGEIVKISHSLLNEDKWSRILKIDDGQDDTISILAINYYIPEYLSSKSWGEDVLVIYEGSIYCSINDVPCAEDVTAPSKAICSSEYNTESYAKENAFDDPDLGETVWLSNESGTGVNGVAYIGQMFTKPTFIGDIWLDQASVEISLAKPVTSFKVQEYDSDTETWSDVQTFSGISGDGLFSLTTPQYFTGIRLLANCDLDTGKYWGVSKIQMFQEWAITAPVVNNVINSTYWELVE